jgi:hypothetical protein
LANPSIELATLSEVGCAAMRRGFPEHPSLRELWACTGKGIVNNAVKHAFPTIAW